MCARMVGAPTTLPLFGALRSANSPALCEARIPWRFAKRDASHVFYMVLHVLPDRYVLLAPPVRSEAANVFLSQPFLLEQGYTGCWVLGCVQTAPE